MATEWGDNTIGAGQINCWYFTRPAEAGFLPVLSVRPLTPSFTSDDSFYYEIGLQSMSFPTVPQLGVSTIWSKMSDDGQTVNYYLMVMNYSNSTIAYSFLESDI